MAELADAHGSGPCEGYFMKVRVLLSAPSGRLASPTKSPIYSGFFVYCGRISMKGLEVYLWIAKRNLYLR